MVTDILHFWRTWSRRIQTWYLAQYPEFYLKVITMKQKCHFQTCSTGSRNVNSFNIEKESIIKCCIIWYSKVMKQAHTYTITAINTILFLNEILILNYYYFSYHFEENRSGCQQLRFKYMYKFKRFEGWHNIICSSNFKDCHWCLTYYLNFNSNLNTCVNNLTVKSVLNVTMFQQKLC